MSFRCVTSKVIGLLYRYVTARGGEDAGAQGDLPSGLRQHAGFSGASTQTTNHLDDTSYPPFTTKFYVMCLGLEDPQSSSFMPINLQI